MECLVSTGNLLGCVGNLCNCTSSIKKYLKKEKEQHEHEKIYKFHPLDTMIFKIEEIKQ